MDNRTSARRMLLGFCGGLLGVLSLGSYADSPTPAAASTAAASSATIAAGESTDATQVMFLGDIKITGQKVIIAVLQQVKAALNRPMDTSKEHENDIVCRFSYSTGSRTREYLTCATNKQFARMRFMAQNKYLGAFAQQGQSSMDADILDQHMSVQNPDHVLRVPLDMSKFEAMLHSVPDAPPESAPSASTASSN